MSPNFLKLPLELLNKVLYYCIPKKKINVAKVRLATEELYKLANLEKAK